MLRVIYFSTALFYLLAHISFYQCKRTFGVATSIYAKTFLVLLRVTCVHTFFSAHYTGSQVQVHGLLGPVKRVLAPRVRFKSLTPTGSYYCSEFTQLLHGLLQPGVGGFHKCYENCLLALKSTKKLPDYKGGRKNIMSK